MKIGSSTRKGGSFDPSVLLHARPLSAAASPTAHVIVILARGPTPSTRVDEVIRAGAEGAATAGSEDRHGVDGAPSRRRAACLRTYRSAEQRQSVSR
jgi:hypothetical protein